MRIFVRLKMAMLAGLACGVLGAMPVSAQDKEIKVGMVNLSLCCAYFVGMDAAVKDEASHFSNVKVLSTDAKGDVAKLTADVEDLLNQNVDVFIISGAWIEAAPAALEAINQAGTPIVMVDRLLKGGDFTAWVGPDNRAIGEGIGDYLVKRLNGKGKVAIIRGGPADNTIGSNRSKACSRSSKAPKSSRSWRQVGASGAPTAASRKWRICFQRTMTSTPSSARTTRCASARRKRSPTPAKPSRSSSPPSTAKWVH